MMRSIFISIFLLANIFVARSQDLPAKKSLEAYRTTEKISIDGILDEESWLQANTASDFTQFEPIPNAAPTYQTEIKILYDNKAVYIGALMLDDEPKKILKELVDRDDTGNASWLAILFDTYLDGQNAFTFFVTAAGGQIDQKEATSGDNNRSWDAVWESNVSIVDNGWIVEAKIPYSALRFPNKDIQTWGIQFGRNLRRLREQSFWNPVDQGTDGFINQAGILTGIKDIKSPVRLSFTPFVTTYLNNTYNPNDDPSFNWGTSYNAGIDLKYGINDAFTLDMTLVPDFGQAQSDDLELNLGPFEQFFEEQRAFFTEGTELFDKSNLFYSRRIGSTPLGFYDVGDQLQENEVVDYNPGIARLYNASKVSGRTTKGLGVGLFNAVARKENATILDTISGKKRTYQTNPLTNYNAIVLDQNLKNNSSITFTNTNVLRRGDDYDANVTGVNFHLKTKDQKWQARGSGALSQKYFKDQDDDFGHRLFLELGEAQGKFTYSMSFNQESDNYDPNDLGFLFSPNERLISVEARYTEYEPTSFLNRYNFWVWTARESLYKPNEFVNWEVNLGGFGLTKSQHAFGFNMNNNLIETFNYFEPRTSDFSRYYRVPKTISFNPWISSDYRRTLALDVRLSYRKFFDAGERKRHSFSIEPRIRFSDRFSIINETYYARTNLDEGFVNKDDIDRVIDDIGSEDILFGIRERKTLGNILTIKYSFSSNMALNFRGRYNWDRVAYQGFGTLQEDGTLKTIEFNGLNQDDESIFDSNFNIFNIDLEFKWRFAPGSDMIVVWKNQVFNQDNNATLNFNDNFDNLFNQTQSNSLSLRFIYFIDYLNLVKV